METGIVIEGIDHVVLIVADIEATCDFYGRVLGMQAVNCAGGRRALAFGRQKINLHRAGCEFAPRARRPTPSSAELCFITPTPLAGVISCLRAEDVAVEDGPVARTGGRGPVTSV